MLEKRSESSEMSDVATAQEMVREIVPRDHRSIGEWIRDTAKALGWSYNRTKNVWYGEARRIDGFEKDALRAAKAKSRLTKIDIEEIRREQWEIRQRLSDLDATLAALDARQDRFLGQS